jgi:hypothetical protein
VIFFLLCCIGAGVHVSSTTSAAIDAIAEANSNSTLDPAWKYCTLPDKLKKHSLRCNFCEKLCSGGITRIKYHLAKIPKSNVSLCDKFPTDVKEEMIALLTKKAAIKESKTKERQRNRAEVKLNHSEGEASDEEEGGNSVVVLTSRRDGSASSSEGGPMEKFCKLTLEEVVADKNGTSSLSKKVQKKLSTHNREERRDRACEYICQFFMKLVFHTMQ